MENQGGAAGFHEGMKRAYEKGYEWLWLMDDDSNPEATCLEKLIEWAKISDVLVPVQIDSTGKRYGAGYWRGRYVSAPLEGKVLIEVDLFSFVGPLIHSNVIAKIGFPRKDFFIWADDLEYSLRIRRGGYVIVLVKEAIIYHDYGGKPRLVKRLN